MVSSKSLNCALLNIQSVTNKTVEIRELITENSLDILDLTETWLGHKESAKIPELLVDTHLFYHIPRETCGEGVGLLLSRDLYMLM